MVPIDIGKGSFSPSIAVTLYGSITTESFAPEIFVSRTLRLKAILLCRLHLMREFTRPKIALAECLIIVKTSAQGCAIFLSFLPAG